MTLRDYELLTSVDALARVCELLVRCDAPFGFDIETGYLGVEDKEKYSLHPETAIVVGISFTNSTRWAKYVPLAHDGGENVDNVEAARLLWPVLNTGLGVAHNAGFERRHLSRWFMRLLADDPVLGEQVRATNGYFRVRSCTQVEAYLVANDECFEPYQSFGLKPLVGVMFGHTMTELHELFPGLAKNKRKFLRFNTLDQHDPAVRNYACEDALWALAIHERYHPRVRDMGLYGVEMEVINAVCEMEDFGVAYDWGYMARGAEVVKGFRDRFNAEIMAELSVMLGQPIAVNLNSPPQISDLLFTKLGLKTTRYTAKTRDLPADQRKMSTDKIALAGLAKQHPVIRRITEWKEMKRLEGTYLSKYEGLYSYAEDGRSHPNHLNAFVITGRFAVSDPPYQQSPKRYHFDLAAGRAAHDAHAQAHGSKCDCEDPEFTPPPGTCFQYNFRDAIIAPPDHYIFGFDLSQAELRAIAGEAREPALLEAFATGQDVHTLTTALMLRIPISEVDKELRNIGKTLNFALLYGMGVKSLADRLAVPVEEAQALYDSYFVAYPNIAVWSERQVAFGKRNRYVTSRFGRTLPVWEYFSDKRWIFQKGDRACVNYPIQGAATGDYMKMAMVRARAAVRRAKLADRVHMVMNVHDALEFYVHRSVPVHQVVKVLKPAVVFPVPGWPAMQADWHVGRRWGSLKELTVGPDGSLSVGGRLIREPVPEVVEDEETGEEVVVLPEVEPEAVRRAVDLVRPRAPQRDPRTVVVQVEQMPAQDGWVGFRRFLGEREGVDTVMLRTPEGDLELPERVDLGPADVARVSLMLGPTKIMYSEGSVRSDDLLQGLTL